MFTCDQFVFFLFIVHAFAFICVLIHDKKQADTKENDWIYEDFQEDKTINPALLEKKRVAIRELNNCETLIEQYMDLYDTIEHELEFSRKESNIIKYKRQLIVIDTKIKALETKRDKAYFIAYVM